MHLITLENADNGKNNFGNSLNCYKLFGSSVEKINSKLLEYIIYIMNTMEAIRFLNFYSNCQNLLKHILTITTNMRVEIIISCNGIRNALELL